MNEPALPRAMRVDQFKLIYDYIKFHLGLYLATPTVFSVVAVAFSLNTRFWFRFGLIAMICVYLVSGIHAAWFMGGFVNVPWDDSLLNRYESTAFSGGRRFMHHTLYWVGLSCGFVGLVLAYFRP
jgi:hypothetical protein